MAPATNNPSSSTGAGSEKSTPTRITMQINTKPKKSKWKLLAKAIIKNRNTESKRISENNGRDIFLPAQDKNSSHLLRFPSYKLIESKILKNFKPSCVGALNANNEKSIADQDVERRTWYQISADGYADVDLKVR